MKNADRIRNMSDEELTEFISSVSENSIIITTCHEQCEKCEKSTLECKCMVSDWLQSESEENNV